MVKVRPFAIEDIHAILALARRMHAEAPAFRERDFRKEKLHRIALSLFANPEQGGIFVAHSDGELVGFFAFVVAEYFFGRDKYAADLSVYVTPEHRGGRAFCKMFKAFENRADELGAVEKIITPSTGIEHERTVALLKRFGYSVGSTGMRKATNV